MTSEKKKKKEGMSQAFYVYFPTKWVVQQISYDI